MTHDPHPGSGFEGHDPIRGADVGSFSMSGGPPSDTLFWAMFLTFALFAGLEILGIVVTWLF
jgi:hypothetical protein